MLSFVNDYSQGAHEAILNRLLQIKKSARLVRVRRQMFFS